MHWIIQDNLYHEVGHSVLLNFLERMNIQFREVKVIPMSQGLPLSERMIPYIDPEGLVMVCGSVSLANVAADVKWTPGSFYNDNHDYQVWKKHYGTHLLNYDAIVCRFGDVDNKWDEFFIRPCGDTKAFSGKIYDWEEFKEWQHKVIDLKECYTTLDANTMVMYSPVKQIYREARFFVVDGRVITQSTYKIGNQVMGVADVPFTMIEYAQRMVDIWQPARAFVLDIALTDNEDDEYKVIEINCINCSGFYEIDIQKFVIAIEEMKF